MNNKLIKQLQEIDLFAAPGDEEIVTRKADKIKKQEEERLKQEKEFLTKVPGLVQSVEKIFPYFKNSKVKVIAGDFSPTVYLTKDLLTLCIMYQEYAGDEWFVTIKAELGTVGHRSTSTQTIGYWDTRKNKLFPPTNEMNIEVIKKHIKELTKGKSS